MLFRSAPLLVHPEFGNQRCRDHVAIVREDNFKVLGVVGADYAPIQNEEQADFIQGLIGEGAKVVACGALQEGRKTFWTVQKPENLTLSDGDEFEQYLILTNGHDGNLAFQAFWSPIRVVCMNTLRAALKATKAERKLNRVYIRHRKNAVANVEQAREVLEIAGTYYEKLGQEFEAMKRVPLDSDGFNGFLDSLLNIDIESGKVHKTKAQRAIQLRENFEGAPGAEPTVFGAYQAVTHFTSHQHITEGYNETPIEERRFSSIMLDQGRKLDQKAFTIARDLVAAAND